MNLIYKHEQPLFIITLLISIVFWLMLIVGTLGTALLWSLFFWIFFLFAHSALISHLKGTAVLIGPKQFPDLYNRVVQSCRKLGVKEIPQTFVLHGDGLFNAFATRFLGRNFVVLYSDVVDALEAQPDAINFYIGHELGHIHRNHILWSPVLWPGNMLPILGAAYSRARESSCDLHGLACCQNPEDAYRGLSALAAGVGVASIFKIILSQTAETGGFWMSLHELIADYPWLVKRMERIVAVAEGRETNFPRRRLRAWILALFIPRLGVGAGSAAASPLIMIAIIGILGAVAIPAYQDFTARKQVSEALNSVAEVKEKVISYASENQKWPSNNHDIYRDGWEDVPMPPLQSIQVGTNGTITLTFKQPPSLAGKTIVLRPKVDGEQVTWSCEGGSIADKYRPKSCRSTDTVDD